MSSMTLRINSNSIKIASGLEKFIDMSITDLRKPMNEIGEYLLFSHGERFELNKGPDGKTWVPNTPVTLAKYIQEKTTARSVRGRAKQQARAATSKQPLRWNNILLTTLIYSPNKTGLTFGTSAPTADYAAMMHYGGRKSQYPHLWGDIPARPYIGIGSEDIDPMTTILRDYFTREWVKRFA